MQVLADQLMERAVTLPDGAPIAAKSLLRLGGRAAVDQALSRRVRRGRLLRAGRGADLRPQQSRFGPRAPSVETVVRAVSERRGKIVASNGAAAANALGLTPQAPIRMVYLTNGRSRTFNVGEQTVAFQHAPAWQLLLADRPAGEAVRALAWLGPEKAGTALHGEAKAGTFGLWRARVGRAASADWAGAFGQPGGAWLRRFARRADTPAFDRLGPEQWIRAQIIRRCV